MSSLIDIEYLFKTHYKRLHRAAYQILHDESLADDTVQEVFIHIWSKKDELNITTTIEGYLVKSTINKALNYIEQNKNFRTVELDNHLEFNSALNQLNSNDFDYKVFQDLVYASLDGLPPRCKTIFVLSRFENMKNKEIAEHLDVSVKTIENQMTIAISRLNSELKPKIQHFFPELIFLFSIFFQIL